MATRDIPVRITEVGIAAEGIISIKAVDEDPTIYHPNSIGDVVDRTGYPNQNVAAPGSTLLRLLDIATLRDEDDGPGFYAAVRGVTTAWNAAVLYESADATAIYSQIKTLDFPAPIGIAKTILASGPTALWDYLNTVDVEMIGGSLESFGADETLRGAVAYLIGQEIILCQNVEQLSATRWRLNGPMVRGYKGTEWAIGTHQLGERFIVLTENSVRRINDALADLDMQRHFKAVTSGQAIENAAVTLFTDTGISLKPISPVDIKGSFDMSDNVVIDWNRRSRLVGRNGRDFFDPPLGEESEVYETDILSDDELTVYRTLTSTAPTVSYLNADQVTDFGATKTSNLHVNVYPISAAVGRGYPGHAVIHPSGESGIGAFEMEFESGALMEFEDGSAMEFETA